MQTNAINIIDLLGLIPCSYPHKYLFKRRKRFYVQYFLKTLYSFTYQVYTVKKAMLLYPNVIYVAVIININIEHPVKKTIEAS